MRGEVQERNNFAALLAVLTGGLVQAVLAPASKMSPNMQRINNGWLFCLTVVFPWAVDLLTRKPKCAMTDSTFKAVAPYTLAVLHFIFANESIPVAFGISPSETGQSYIRIYLLLLERMDAVFEHLVNHAGQLAPGVKLEDKDVVVPWPVDPDDDDLCEPPAPPAKETESEEDYFCLPPECFPDGSELQQLPDVPERSPDPAPSTDGERAPWRRLLLDLPIITDQGKALEKFVNFFKLTWKLCHRHIIEAIGANGRLAEWVLRILRCFSRGQFLRARKTILIEMHAARGTLKPHDHAYRCLLRLLGLRPSDKKPLCDIHHWALWLRLGCPTTTNSAESVNGHLNAEIEKDQSWPRRVVSVATHFLTRYQSRQTWRDRSLTRNKRKCYPEEEGNPWQAPEETLFYLHLHDAFEKTSQERAAEKFPPAVQALWFGPTSACVPGDDDLSLPNGWEIKRDVHRRRDRAPEAEPPKIEIHERSARPGFARLAWQMIWTFRKQLGANKWMQFGQAVNVAVIRIGESLGLGTGIMTCEQEAEWWSACWDAFPRWARGEA
jgi:hypothetical protein